MVTKNLRPTGLELSQEEAFALLEFAMSSPIQLDATSESAIHKLAEYCKTVLKEEPRLLPRIEAAG